MITIDELKFKLGGLETAVNDLRDALSIEASEKRLAELEHQMTLPGFYDDQEKSQKVISEMGEVKNKLERFGKLSTQYEEAQTLLEMIEEENDPSLAAEGEEAVNGVEKSIDELQLMTMLNGEYDHSNAILTFHAGTGGTEAQDLCSGFTMSCPCFFPLCSYQTSSSSKSAPKKQAPPMRFLSYSCSDFYVAIRSVQRWLPTSRRKAISSHPPPRYCSLCVITSVQCFCPAISVTLCCRIGFRSGFCL